MQLVRIFVQVEQLFRSTEQILLEKPFAYLDRRLRVADALLRYCVMECPPIPNLNFFRVGVCR
jgi:hypothetical protein